jgi:hypothetical protein
MLRMGGTAADAAVATAVTLAAMEFGAPNRLSCAPDVVGVSWTSTSLTIESDLLVLTTASSISIHAADDDRVVASWLVRRDAARESRWIVATRAALPPGTPAERAAVVLWSACGAWTDAPSGRWGELADLAGDLADALDGVAGCARATALRGVMGSL